MGQRIKSPNAEREALLLLDQAIVLLDEARMGIVAAQVDFARQKLAEFLSDTSGGSRIPVASKAGGKTTLEEYS